MSRTDKLSVTVPKSQLTQVKSLVDAGEFESAAAVVREALRSWLHRRALYAGRHGAAGFKRTLEARRQFAQAEPSERVELLFDAGDAKA